MMLLRVSMCVGCLLEPPLVSSKVGDFLGALGAKAKSMAVTCLGSWSRGA